jgi:hypothetical protein
MLLLFSKRRDGLMGGEPVNFHWREFLVLDDAFVLSLSAELGASPFAKSIL